jgi:LysM repeat protein
MKSKDEDMIKIRKRKKSNIKVGDSVYWIEQNGGVNNKIIYEIKKIIGNGNVLLHKNEAYEYALDRFIKVSDYK